MAEESQYAYFLSSEGLVRVTIPLSDNEEFKIEPVFHNRSNPPPVFMGIFSHNDTIYMVGGQIGFKKEYNRSMYVFDPKRFQKLPVGDLNCLDTSKELGASFKPIPMVAPYVIKSGSGRIYILSVYDNFLAILEPFRFQSFDPTENHFETLTSPPDSGIVDGYFLLGDYIYLFISKTIRGNFCEYAFTFNTRSSEWKERKELLHQFGEKDIPIPYTWIGDVGLSDELPDKSRIMVTLGFGNPIAYCIHLGEDGSLSPNSFRCLYELYKYREYTEDFESIFLLDMGGGRFCVVYQNDEITPLLIYVFKIDYEVEHRIQISSIKEKNPSSVQVLSSMKWELSIPWLDGCSITALCLASATNKTTSNQGRDMVATSDEGRDMAVTSNEDKDGDKKNIIKSRRRRRGKNSIKGELSHKLEQINEKNPSSIQVLSSNKSEVSIPLVDRCSITAHCLASATNKATSNEGRDMAATSNEDKDVDKKNKIKSRTRRGGKKSINGELSHKLEQIIISVVNQ